MKMKAPHRVYLSWQALELLGLLKAFGSEPQASVLPSVLRAAVPLGDATGCFEVAAQVRHSDFGCMTQMYSA
jgi:hypothetical protein